MRYLFVVAAMAAGWFVGSARPAAACSCTLSSVTEDIRRLPEVYIAKPRAIDLFPGASFRVQRVLKGTPRSNIRVDVARGGRSCGTSVPPVEYVLTTSTDGSATPLSRCNEHMRGSDAVREATAALGRGTAAPRRLDPLWLAQWVLLAGIGSLVALRLRHRTT